MNSLQETLVQAVRAFLRPTSVTAVGRNSPLPVPFLLAAALRVTLTWLDTRMVPESAATSVDWTLAAIEPLLLALFYHGIVRVLLKRSGELRDLFRLFCYASIAMDVLLLPLSLLAIMRLSLWWLREGVGALMFPYWLYVAGRFSCSVYGLTTRQSAILTGTFVACVVLAAFGVGYIGYRLSIPGHPMLATPAHT